jgi:preprotein translocase subunit SecG
MNSFILALHVVGSLALILIVLLQSGKGDMGAAFGGGGGGQSFLGNTGAVSFLGKITTFIAVMFMVTSLYLAYSSNLKAKKPSLMTDKKVEQTVPAEKAKQ